MAASSRELHRTPGWVVLVALLLPTSATWAAPGERAESPAARADAERFVSQFVPVVRLIVGEYVRPLKTADLYEAAIRKLADTARRPVPDDLLRELRQTRDETEQTQILVRARARLHGAPELDKQRDLYLAIASLTTVLDPHSVLVPSNALSGTATMQTFGFELHGEARLVPLGSTGDGELPGLPDVPFRVLTVKPGSPAQKAGLRPGDLLRSIQGIPVELSSAERAFEALHDASPAGQKCKLFVERAESRGLLELVLERDTFIAESVFGVTRKRDNAWDHWLDPAERIAYVRLGAIESDSGERFQEVLRDLRDVRGLVFDLRWCPGGYIDAATEIASTFLESGVIARMNYRNPERGSDSVIRADGGLVRYKAGDYPVLVLVNGETIGGGELIAAALRDNDRVRLAGTRTFGKATIQWPLAVPGLTGLSFKVTGGTYTRPNGKNLQRYAHSTPRDDWGLRPDAGLEFPMSAELTKDLGRMHLDYTLRPGGSREAHPLDDPAADPQRQHALKAIRRLVRSKESD